MTTPDSEVMEGIVISFPTSSSTQGTD
jgi:hypothetical protein